ncbi:MAG: polysaccharide biosynthesis/export family protein [Nitrospinales bacterium]
MREFLFWSHRLKIAGLIILAFIISSCAIDKEALQARASWTSKKDNHAKIRGFTRKKPDILKARPYKPYILGVEDVIKITVINDKDLNTTQSIRPDGKISFFPKGDLQAAGLTLEQLRREIVKRLKTDISKPYTLGEGDVIKISVFNNSDLETTQAIRPDGKISVIPVGDMQASGLTVEALRERIVLQLSTLIKSPMVSVSVEQYNSNPVLMPVPIVNVTVEAYNSRKVTVLGEVEKPGVLKIKSDITLIEGISQLGGLSDQADLKRAMFFRDEKLVSVDFYKLFKQGDISQNIWLKANDSIFIPSSRDNKIYVIGEVRTPGSITWEGSLTYLEAIALAGGYTRKAQNQNVVVIQGGLVDPNLTLLDAESITKRGLLENNIHLTTGDIIYVPQTVMATMERYLDFVNKLIQPILTTESSIILGNQVKDIFTGGDTGGTPIAITP